MDQIIVSASKRYGQPHTLEAYQALSRRFLTSLHQVHPIFSRLGVSKHGRFFPISETFSDLEEIIAKQVYDPAHPERYLQTHADGQLAPQSLCRIGFDVSYYSAAATGTEFLGREQGGIELALQGGATSGESGGQIIVKLPTNGLSYLHSKPILKKLLQLTLSIWGCTRGRIRSLAFEKAINGTNSSSCGGQWLLYLPCPGLAGCFPNDIQIEKFERGILISAAEEMPDHGRTQHVAAGRRIAQVLDELGLLSNAEYAIEGWPPDPEEWRYEEFISGAPRGRKYTVHCIDFDGYDAERKVLLYAKLFRRLRRHPKAWGLRGWDGPVLNEAKRQVRAAAKAGGVPIEWHIGIEESAERVRELLTDHTDITEAQLKVIHTPLEQALKI